MHQTDRIGLFESLLDTFLFHGQARPGTITVRLIARGEGDTMYTITESGIHAELLDRFTEQVIGGILEFWSWLAPVAEESGSEPAPRRRGRRPRTDA